MAPLWPIVTFPKAIKPQTVVTNKSYRDVELIPVSEGKVRIGKASEGELSASGAPIIVDSSNSGLWASVIMGLLVLLAIVLYVVKKTLSAGEGEIKASDVFKMPEDIDPFVVVRLLRSL